MPQAPAHLYQELGTLGETLLGAHAVVFVAEEGGSGPTVLGRSDSARTLTESAIHEALAVPPTRIDLGSGEQTLVTGTRIGAAPPLDRVIRILPPLGDATLAALVFAGDVPVRVADLQKFAQLCAKQLGEQVLMDRYRSDLKRFVTMIAHVQRTAKIGIWEMACHNGHTFWSGEARRILGRDAGEELTLDTVLSQVTEQGRRRLEDGVKEARLSGIPCDITLAYQTPLQERRMLRFIASREGSEEDGVGFRLAGVVQDVTTQHETSERLWWLANHDVLTGLPNRALFADRVAKALQRRERTSKVLCLVLVDVDNFKTVNDTMGHAAGDELLKNVGRRLLDAVRTNDTVARTGGDEFSVLMEDLDSMETLHGVLARLRNALQIKLGWQERSLNVSLSAGAAAAPDHGKEADELTALADLALYRSKSRRDGILTLYSPALGRAAAERNRLLMDARRALEDGAFVPYYQPQVDVTNGRIVGVEALARWVRPDGVWSASAFSSALSDAELGSLIGQAIVQRALADLAIINSGREHKIALSVNASAGELLHESFLREIGRLNAEHTATRGPITVEITEDVILDDPNGELAKMLREANSEGIDFSLDDFGTGYASLVHITKLPISEVKIDRQFIAEIEADQTKQTVIRGMIDVARSLGLRLIIEGVETPQQVNAIRELGATFVQGFFYSRPLPLEQLRELLDDTAAEITRAGPNYGSDDQSLGRCSWT